MIEEWRPVVGYEGLYEVSNTGQVRSLDRYVKYSNGRIHLYKGKVLSPGIKPDGYLLINLCCNGKHNTIRVHRLVTEAFLPNPDNLPEVNHKDEDKTNNRVENLEWCDYVYNNNYGTKPERLSKSKIGRIPWNKGVPMSEEIKIKLRGRTFSEEHRKHLSDAQKNRPRSEEEIQRCRTAFLGKHHTEEAKQKMSEKRKLFWMNKKSINN